MKRFFTHWLPVLAWCSLIFYLSSLPNLQSDLDYDFVFRKIAHMAEYAVLLLLMRRAFADSYPQQPPALVNSLSLVLTVLYAASDEYHQSLVPTRGPSAADVGIDTIGAFLGFAAFLLWRKTRGRPGTKT